MRHRRLRVLAAALLALSLGAHAEAGEMASYRARYSLSLDSSQTGSGVVGAGGVIVDQWNETCTGWTEQEHYYLHLDYGDDRRRDQDSLDTFSAFVSWESRDALHYQFDLRQAETDTPYEEIRGVASLGGPGKGGTAQFSRPGESVLALPPGTAFPSAHTRFLIARAEAGDQLVTRQVFDGSEVAGATQITAAIGPKLPPGAVKEKPALKSPLLDRPSWRMRLAFFPPDRNSELPDYEESVRLLDNGVIASMLFDYGDYAVRAKLTHIVALHRPPC